VVRNATDYTHCGNHEDILFQKDEQGDYGLQEAQSMRKVKRSSHMCKVFFSFKSFGSLGLELPAP
jgi:hypothetical protein